MSFIVFYKLIRTLISRINLCRKLKALEKIKLNSVRNKHKIASYDSYWDRLVRLFSFPLTLVFGILKEFFGHLIGSTQTRQRTARETQMSRVFKNMTEENQLLRQWLYYAFGAFLAYLVFLFIYYFNFLTNYRLIAATLALVVFFTLVAPFKQIILCYILIALPSLFSSKIRYILVTYVLLVLYLKVGPDIVTNGMTGLKSVGCSFMSSAEGSKNISALMVKDVKDFIGSTKEEIKDMIDNLKKFAKRFSMNIRLPSLRIKEMCNVKSSAEVDKCKDKMSGLMKPLCSLLVRGMAGLCTELTNTAKEVYNKTKEAVMEAIRELECQLVFDADLNQEFDYHYNTSRKIIDAFKDIGSDWMDRHYGLRYWEYLFDLRVVILFAFSFWIFLISFVYLYRYKKADHFDNCYLNQELVKIDEKRLRIGRETVFPLQNEEKYTFIYPFDVVMTRVELNRFIMGAMLALATLIQVVMYCSLDLGIYYLILWYNQFIDVLSHIFSPAKLTFQVHGDNFVANRLRKMNDGFDVKQKIVKRLNDCKADPIEPTDRVYNEIKVYLLLILITLLSSAYGLRLRHYVAGLFYPKRIPIRAVWLYNDILCRRGTIFNFWRKQMLKRTFGDSKTESFSMLDRICAKFPIIRLVCRLVGLYGKQNYCQSCGRKVMADGSDHSTKCGNDCPAMYCTDCVDDQNNICAVCMNPINYHELGDFSEELDSSEEDIAYDIHSEDFLYQFSKSTPYDMHKTELWDDHDIDVGQRRDLVSFAYRYDSTDRVPKVVYIVDEDNGYDGDDETQVTEEYQRSLFELEQELGIPAEEIDRMKRNAQKFVSEDMEQKFENRAKEERYSELKREYDQRLVRNAMILVNRDKRRYKDKYHNKS